MTDVVLRIQTALGGAVAEVNRFRQVIADTATTTVDLREQWKATTSEIVAQTQQQIASEKEKIDQYRAEIKTIGELTSTYAKGSDERQIATKMEIDLQHKLQAALGETAAASARSGAAGARSAEERDLSGLGRGAASRSGVAGVGMSALAGPGFIVGAVVGGVLDAGVKAAKEEAVAQANLANALKDTGQARQVSRKALDAYVAVEEHSTGFQRNEVMQTLSQLIRSTGSLAKARSEEAVMANVARARNTDLSGAMMLVMRASEGNVGSLKRLGIELPKVTTYEDQLRAAHLTGNMALDKRAKALDLAATKTEVMRAVTQKFSGDSSAYMHTFAGETAGLSNTWRDLEVEIGQKAIPVLTSLFSWLEKEISALEQNKQAHRDLHDAVVVLETAFKTTETVIRDVDKVTGGFGNTMKLVLTYFAAGKILAFANAIRKDLVGAVNAFKAILPGVAAEEDAAFPWMAIAQAAAVAVVLIIEHWKTVESWMLKFWGWLKDAGRAAWAALQDLAQTAVYAILQYATAAIRGILEVASHIPFIGDSARHALDAINTYIDTWKPNFSNVITAFRQGGSASGKAFAAAALADVRGTPGALARQAAAGTGGRTQIGGGVSIPNARGVQGRLVSAGMGAVGNAYQYGGTPSLSSPTDCSGLMVAIFAKQGIQLPRTSEAQYAQAPIKNARPLAPGDLVFTEGVHPGHVGLYVGNGTVLQDPHTGASVDTISIQDFGWNGESARWWAAKAKATPKGGSSKPTTAMPAGWDKAVTQASAAAAAAKAGKGGLKEPGLITIRAAIDAELRDLPKHLDAVEEAAVKHIKELRAELHVGMSQVELAKDRAELARWGKMLKDEVKKNAEAAKKAAREAAADVKEAARAAAKAWADGWRADVSIIDRSISEAWAQVQKGFDRSTQATITAMQRNFQAQMAVFDKQTQKGLQGFVVAQTPQEKALADFQAQVASQQSAAAHAQLQSDLSAAIATGDPAQIKQAQDAINQQLQADQEAALQTAADASRAAADAQTQTQQDAYQAQRDAQKQAFTDQETAAEQAYQDQRDSQWQALQDQHDDQVTMFDADLQLWQTALQNKSKTWAQFLEWLAANPVSSAMDGSGIVNPLTYTGPTIPGDGGDGGTGPPAGSRACFIGTTLVDTPTGTRRIDMLEPGDKILVWDFTTNGFTAAAITVVDRHEGTDVRDTVTVESGGRELVGTPDHIVYDGSRWTPLAETPALFRPRTDSLHPTRILAGPRTAVYNLHVDHPDHNYVANGFLVHNAKASFAAGGVHLRPTIGMFGDHGPEATIPLAGQAGQQAINQLARAIVQAAAGMGGGGGTTIYGTFLGATEKQVGRALEGLVTPAQKRIVRYPAPL